LPTLTDYLDLTTLRSLQGGFTEASGAKLWICDGEGRPILEPPAGENRRRGKDPEEGLDVLDVPILVQSETVGRVRARPAGPPPRSRKRSDLSTDPARLETLLSILADLISRLCEGERQLRARAGELATLFALTAEFAGMRDLQSLLDLVARTVVNVLRARACSIRLLSEDGTELLIQSVANLSKEYLNKGPILLAESRIDREVLESARPIYIADERVDPRVLYREEARREGLVSALCAPMIYKGRREGVIRVYTARQYEFDWFEVSLLETIAAQAAASITNARLHTEAEQAANLRRHLRAAAEVQRRMTPVQMPEPPGMSFGAVYVPCFDLAGDFYDFIDLPENNLGVAIGDVAGKGVRASLLMASIRASLRAHAASLYEISEILNRVNRDLCATSLESDFVSLFYGVVDLRTRRFTYANCGHPAPLLFRDGVSCKLETGGPIVGLTPDFQWRHQHFTLRQNDVFVAFTDGLSEALNFKDEGFGRERIERAALEAIEQGLGARSMANHILWQMRRFAGLQTRLDDVTLLVIRVGPPPHDGQTFQPIF
jgi:sigma-B regulation protein RsbU (phosphoserine phosphatase)